MSVLVMGGIEWMGREAANPLRDENNGVFHLASRWNVIRWLSRSSTPNLDLGSWNSSTLSDHRECLGLPIQHPESLFLSPAESSRLNCCQASPAGQRSLSTMAAATLPISTECCGE